MKFILLTHYRETQKASNTGQLVQKHVANTQIIIWQRTQPDSSLLELISAGNTALLYPGGDDAHPSFSRLADYENFILIDSTWQEARKIYNRSPYLKSLPCIQLPVNQSSSYTLRRNQLEGGLCTAECAIELLKIKQFDELAIALEEAFFSFVH